MELKGSVGNYQELDIPALAVPVFTDEKADSGILQELDAGQPARTTEGAALAPTLRAQAPRCEPSCRKKRARPPARQGGRPMSRQ